MEAKLVAVLVLLVVAACMFGDRPAPKAAPGALPTLSPPLIAKTQPAPSGSALRVFVDRDRIVGWVAGSGAAVGTPVQVAFDGAVATATIDGDNAFGLPYRVTKSTEATITVGTHVQRVTLEPRATAELAAYIVVDRTAYRPGQKLGFAAFLRKPDGNTFVPVGNAKVEARIISDTKQTVAARLSLVADVNGRVAGEYTFSSGDPLDSYTVSIPGYAGTARIVLAEYRKSKVKLEVDARIAGRSAAVAFRALDFLDKAVPGGSVAFTAQIVRDADAGPSELGDFAFGAGPLALAATDRLLIAADDRSAIYGTVGRTVASELSGKVALDARGSGSYQIPIKSEWLRGHHRLLVDATIVDANGREQRATRAIPLARGEIRVELATPHQLLAAGDPTEVAVRVVDAKGQRVPATTSLTAIRLQPTAPMAFGYDSGWNGWNGWSNSASALPCRHTSAGCWGRQRKLAYTTGPVETLAATSVVTQDKASITLDDPGAYRLVASAKLADGSTVWSETGVAVREPDELPTLVLELARDEVRHGERIVGQVHARYRDARVLVVARDGNGIAARKRVTLVDGRAAIDLPVGTLGHGAAVEAYVLGTGGKVHAAQELLRVIPTTKQLAITTAAKPTYGPGETVELDIAVDRKEAVDLVVSVYDQALLGIAPDRAPSPLGFFHGDRRFHTRAALATLRAELGDVTIGALVTRAREVAKTDPDPETAQMIHNVLAFENGSYSAHQLVALLRFAGIPAAVQGYPSWHGQVDGKVLVKRRVIDVIERDAKLAFTRIADAILIGDPSAITMFSYGNSRGAARGDSHFSVTGNAVFSAPAAPDLPAPLDVDGVSTDVVRRDFSDSAFWSGHTRTGPDGKTRVRFKLPDSLTNWHVVVTAVGRDTAVGRHVTKLRTVRDLMVWPMIPRQFTEGDTVSVFASVHNLTDIDRDIVVSIKADNADVLSPAQVTVRVPRGGNVPVIWPVRAREPGLASLVMTATSGTIADASLKRIPVAASSAQQVVTASGFATKPLTVELPAGVDPKTATLEVTFAPSLAADMIQTLDYLVEYPHGCAEQTMSRFTPAIRVAGILDNLGIRDSALAARLPSVVEGGIKRLIDMQQPDGGWGWQYGGQTHEMMTPYVMWGLLEAEKAGYKLPSTVAIDRGLTRLRAFIETMGAAQLADRTYLMYVYSQREKLPDSWWRGITEHQDKLSDYGLALALEMALARNDRKTADQLVTRLRDRAHRTGGWSRWRTAGFSRWMEDPFEVTAAVLKALVKYDADDALVPEVIAYFVANKRGDRWNSTKDTAMVLFALTEYLGKKGIKASGRDAAVEYTINGGARTRLAFADGLVRKISVGKLGAQTTIAFPQASAGMMARAVLKFRRSGRDLGPAAQGLEVTRQLFLLGAAGKRGRELRTGDRIPRGSYVESVVTVAHTANEAMRYLLVEDPKPSGAEALPIDDPRFPAIQPTWSLREDRESGMAYHHEETAASTTTRTILHLELAGELAIAPAQAELMYQTETRGSSGTLVLRVE